MRPHTSLRLASRTRRVEQNRGSIGRHLGGRQHAVLVRHEIAPPPVPPVTHRRVDGEPFPFDDHNVAHGRRRIERRIEHGLERRRSAAPPGAACRDHCFGATVIEARLDRLWTEAGEEWHHNRADLQDCEERDKRLRQIGHVDRDDIALADVKLEKALRETPDLVRERPIGQMLLFAAVLAFPDQEGPIPCRRVAVPVDAVENDICGAADAPARPRQAAREIEDPLVGTIESDIAEAEHFFHQPGRIGVRARGERVIVRLRGLAQKRRQIAVLHQRGRRRPDIGRCSSHDVPSRPRLTAISNIC